MTHKIAYVTPASAVATSGTFTAAYPTDTTAGDFAAYGHKVWAEGLQAMFKQDDGMISVSFGASDITVTYRGTTSLPANKQLICEFNMAGVADAPVNLVAPKRITYMPIVKLDLGAPDTADDNGIVESQDLTAAGVYSVLAFNGVYGDPYANTKAVLDVPRNVVAGWTGTAVLTVTGKDEYGDIMVESSASSTSFTGKKAFKEITSIAVSANVTSLTVGTGDVLGLPVYVDKIGGILQEYQDGVALAKFGSNKILIPFTIEQTELLAGTAADLNAPCAGYITGMKVSVEGAITTGGALTVELNTSTVTGLSVTLANSATAGTVYQDDILKIAAGLAAEGDDITITPAAAIDTGGSVTGYLIFEPIAELNGTFVAGVQTTPTATTGDVRGTYDPAEACNGSLSFSLLAAVADPAYKGVDNYDG